MRLLEIEMFADHSLSKYLMLKLTMERSNSIMIMFIQLILSFTFDLKFLRGFGGIFVFLFF